MRRMALKRESGMENLKVKNRSPDAHLTAGKCFFRRRFLRNWLVRSGDDDMGWGRSQDILLDKSSYQPPPPPPPPPPPEEPPPLLPLDEDGLVAAAATAAVIAVPRPAVVAAMVDAPHPSP